MADDDFSTTQFEAHRAHLGAVAYRMLGSRAEADDAVQEAWLRLHRARARTGEAGAAITNLGGWLTAVVARVCLDALRARKARREQLTADVARDADVELAPGPEADALAAGALDAAALVVLETLTPAERVAFVLHDVFELPFEDVARVVGRSVAATRQLASRARRRSRDHVRDDDRESGALGPTDDDAREVVRAFLAASRTGDLGALLGVLDPAVVLRADAVAVATSAAGRAAGAPELSTETHGASAVAAAFLGRARAARLARFDGAVGATWAPGGVPRVLFAFTLAGGKIVEVEVLADAATLERIDVVMQDV